MKALRKLLATTVKLVVVIGIVAGGYYGYQMYAGESEEEELGEMLTYIADVRDITVAVSATGVLRPVKIVEIKSKASGEILEMPVEMGDYLEAGDLIAQIDTRIIDQELKQAAADFESAKIRLEIADKQYGRAKSLHAQDLISANDLESSEQSFVNAESQFIRSEASLELARERLEDTTVTAPITGRVLSKTVEQGQIIASSTNNVSGGTVMITMADLSELEIRTLVDEIDIGNVKPGLRVESTVEAFADMEFEGEVMKIEPAAVVQQSVTTFPVLSRIDNSRGLLLPGMNADVSIIIHKRGGVLTVSNEAVRSPDDAREIVQLLGIDAQVVAVAQHARLAAARQAQTGAETAASNGDNGSVAEHADRIQVARAGDAVRQQVGVVFVLDAEGRMTPREVVTGVRDWEVAEVIAGLENGEEVVLLPSTSLLRSQDRMRQRYSQRSAVVPVASGR